MRRRGADVSLAAPMPDQMPGEAAPQSQRARAGVNIERATEVAGDDLAPFQRIDQMLGKRGPLSQDFALDDQEYFQFWTDISRNVELTKNFLADLVRKLAQVEKDLSKSTPKASDPYVKQIAIKLYNGDQRQALQSTRNALVSSIFFVQLHFDFEIDSTSNPLRAAMQKWRARLPHKSDAHASVVRSKDHMKDLKKSTRAAAKEAAKVEKAAKKVEKQQVKDKQSQMPASTEFEREVYEYVEEKGTRFGDDMFSAVTDQLESVVHIESKRGMNAPFDVPAQVEEKTVGPAWTWLYLRHRFTTPDELTRALNEIVDMLRVHNTEPRLLCLLQMLTEIIQTYPCLPIDPMRRLKAALDPFYCWPCPFGPLAQRLIATAERELASPGAAFREGFLLEHPNLVLISGEHLSDLYQPVIPVYYDSSAPNARFLQLSLTTPAANSSPRSHDDGDHSDIGTHVVDDARNMLLDIFQRAGADVLELPSDAAEQLAGRQPEDLLAMYKEARQVDLEAQQRRTEEAARGVLEALGPIALKAFEGLIEGASGGGSPWKRLRRPARTASTTHEVQQTRTPLSLDALAFELHAQAELSPDGPGTSWPTAHVENALEWLRHLASQAPDGTVSIRLAVAGGTQTLHHLLNAIELLRAEMRRDEHETARQLSVSIFLVPTSPSVGENALAECIARTDCWYGRHVAIPWSTLLPAFPHVLPLRPDNARPEPGPELASSSSSVMQPLLAPCMAMRNLVQNYVRHASNRLEVNVFCCHCRLNPGRDYGTGMRIIYGCDRVSFGSVVYKDLVDPRAKEPHVPSVDLEFRVVGIDGSPIEQKKFQNRQFRTLDVCNLPRRGQKTACAIPSDPVLELVSQLTDSGKKKKASTQGGLEQHVDEVTITGSLQDDGGVERFSMLLDGVRYGPFAEVHVTCYNPEGQHDAQLQRRVPPLHVMSYLPVLQ